MGFDLFGDSLRGFGQDYLVQGVLGILLLTGAIGFPVIMELYSYLVSRRRGGSISFPYIQNSLPLLLLFYSQRAFRGAFD